MTTRAQIAAWALSQVGTVAAKGFDGPNPYSAKLGRPAEAWCGDFATCAFLENGEPLPSMQMGCSTGFAYVPDGMNYRPSSWVDSWEAEPGDLACFDWNGDGVPDHVEVVVGWSNGTLTTVGGNSGTYGLAAGAHTPVVGGVNEHAWSAPARTGNPLVLHVISTAALVTFTAPPPAGAPRLLMLKSPLMAGDDVGAVQEALNAHHAPGTPLATDGVYGPKTSQAVRMFQAQQRLTVSGIVGPQTRSALGL